MKVLFLDDSVERVAKLSPGVEIVYVRTVAEFIKYLTENGTPDVISFDRDLSECFRSYPEPPDETGEDCARWVIENGFIPEFVIVHSLNTVCAPKIAQQFRNIGHSKVFIKPFDPNKIHV